MVPERHNHLPGRLHLLVEKILEQWTSTNIAISAKVDQAKAVYTLFEPIIKYFNAVASRFSVSCKPDIFDDYKRFIELKKEFEYHYKEKEGSVRELADNMKLLELIAMEDTLKGFMDTHNQLFYVATLSENQIWETYKGVI